MCSHMSPSGGTICRSCVPCCLCRWLSLWIVYCHQFRPAMDSYVRLALLSWWESRPEGPDVPRDECGQYVWWGHRLVTFRSSRLRILRMCRVRWSTTVGLRCSLSLNLSGIGPLSGLSTVVSASVVVNPREDGLTISGGGGGGGLRWTSCSGAWSSSTGRLGDRPGGQAIYAGWLSVH